MPHAQPLASSGAPQPESLRLLLPTVIDPRSHRGGGGSASRPLIKLLQRQPLGAQVEYVVPSSALEGVHLIRQVSAVARSLISPLPSKPLFTRTSGFVRGVRRRVRSRHWDLILLNCADLLWLLPALPSGVPRLLLAHNIEHELFRSQIETVGPRVRPLRRLLMRDCRRLEAFELGGMREVSNVVFLSVDEAEYARQRVQGLNPLVVPPLFDYPPSSPAKVRDAAGAVDVGFLGGLGWWPNRAGLDWFLDEVFPYAGEGVRVHVFGDGTDRLRPRHPRIIPHGYLADPCDIWRHCDFMICPGAAGAGVSIKFAEAIYNRMPVLARPFAARGLPLEPHPGIVLLEKPREWVEFLRSPAAARLSTQQIPDRLANAFAMDAHHERVCRYVSRILHRSDAAC